ncbi:MAG: LytR/AlgR family response regulator transcription factor [Nitritalea sp.]
MQNKEIRALIVDDEPMARMALKGILSRHFSQVAVLDEAKSLPEAVKLIHKHKPDVVFLDIEMPGYSGLEILDFFPEQQVDFRIIFVTAYQDYALKAFELSAVDYLLKPVQQEALERALQKVVPQLQARLQTLKENLAEDKPKKITLQTGEGILFIPLRDIIYLKADGSYTHFHLDDGKKITVSKRLQEYERIMDMGKFMRIHRSHIINLDQIAKITKEDGGAVHMSNGEMLSISNEKKQLLMHHFERQKL